MLYKKALRLFASALILAAIATTCYGYYFYHYPQVNGYRAVIDAKHVMGIDGGLSGLTWNPQTQTLFAVTDDPSLIVELDTDGNTLRVIPVSDGEDLEALEYLDNERYVISQEKARLLNFIVITPQTRLITLEKTPSVHLDFNYRSNNSGFEGITWEQESDTLTIGQEKRPLVFYTLNDAMYNSHHNAISIGSSPLNRYHWHLMIRDVSDMDYRPATKETIVLSKKSKRAVFITPDGHHRYLHLVKGQHGLHNTIPQAEGIASDNSGNIYIVSEPDLFYKLVPKPALSHT